MGRRNILDLVLLNRLTKGYDAGMSSERWMMLAGSHEPEWLLESKEPAARWVTLTHLLDRPDDEPEVIHAREEVLADERIGCLISSLPDWEVDAGASGHNSPLYAPNLLGLLADMGIEGGDDERIESLLDRMLAHQDESGRFESFGRIRGLPQPVWGSLLCDHHIITDVLLRFGRGDDKRVRVAIDRIAADLGETNQGTAWHCMPHTRTEFRGPGRKDDFCPQATLEALRVFGRLPLSQRPRQVLQAARTAVRAWRRRGEEKPYLFGHGRQFKTTKWPAFWYDLHYALDALGWHGDLWEDETALPEDRKSLAEMLACLVAYNFDAKGCVTPKSCYRGFESFSFGQKKHPSPFATASLCFVLRRFGTLADEVRNVDVLALTSSRGGSGKALPPK